VVGKALRACAVLAVAAAAGLTSCGGVERPAPKDEPAVPAPQAFPRPAGRTLEELRAELGPGPRLVSSVSVLEPGRNRVAFALFDRARRQIGDTPVALYSARADGTDLHGPFMARYEPLAVKPRFRSRTSAADPDSARLIYVASPEFRAPGEYLLLGVAQLDGRLVGASPVTAVVRRGSRPPDVGELAPRVHTPTRASAHGRMTAIDTRVPPDSMHDVDLANVLGRRPVMLLFATPALCRSRICGPVTDIEEELKSERSRDAAFIHVEIYKDNRVSARERPAVRAYGLPSEPWLFAIDRSGRVAARIEGAFSLDEARRALDAAVRR
jgi:hypothetical protein